MSWEDVKGFFRRRKQQFGEQYGKAAKTEDEYVDQTYPIISQYQRVARSNAERLKTLSSLMNQMTTLLLGMKEDLCSLHVQELDVAARRVELCAAEFGAKAVPFVDTIQGAQSSLEQYCAEVAKIGPLFEDRKAKMLEFDFFRNKVTQLKADPGTDPVRIPRNEARLDDWCKQYEASNEVVKRSLQTMRGNGDQLLQGTSQITVNALKKFHEDISISLRALFPSPGGYGGLMQQIQSNAATVAAATLQQNPNVVNQVNNAAASTAALAQQGSAVLQQATSGIANSTTNNDSFASAGGRNRALSGGVPDPAGTVVARQGGTTRASSPPGSRRERDFNHHDNDDPFQIH